MTKNRKPRAPPELVRDAKLKLTVRAPDGASFTCDGNFPNRVAFGVYMLACDWGDGSSHKVRSKRDKAFEAAARAYLEAAEEFHDSVAKPAKGKK